GIFILSDLAYAEVYFDENPPPSVLQVAGALEVTVEFTSMSKTYSMPGWRIGFAVGNERIIAALARVKSYLDYGAFTPAQVAATGTCASRALKPSSGFVRRPATSAVSLKPARRRCTTSSPSPSGAERAAPGHFMVAPLKVGLAGLGTVGAGVVRLIERQRAAL